MTDVLRLIREDELQQTITDLLDLYGYLWHHEVDSRKSKRGLPDLIWVGPGGVLHLWELKTETGRLRPEQIIWGEALRQCTQVQYELVRPRDLPRLVEDLR